MLSKDMLWRLLHLRRQWRMLARLCSRAVRLLAALPLVLGCPGLIAHGKILNWPITAHANGGVAIIGERRDDEGHAHMEPASSSMIPWRQEVSEASTDEAASHSFHVEAMEDAAQSCRRNHLLR